MATKNSAARISGTKKPVLPGLDCYNDKLNGLLSVSVYFAAFTAIIITISTFNSHCTAGIVSCGFTGVGFI